MVASPLPIWLPSCFQTPPSGAAPLTPDSGGAPKKSTPILVLSIPPRGGAQPRRRSRELSNFNCITLLSDLLIVLSTSTLAARGSVVELFR